MVSEFRPYKIYQTNLQAIDDFNQFTQVSNAIALQLLFKFPKDKIQDLELPDPAPDGVSYCEGDYEAVDANLLCEWISLREYANRKGLHLDVVKSMALKGELGVVMRIPMMEIKWPYGLLSIKIGLSMSFLNLA